MTKQPEGNMSQKLVIALFIISLSANTNTIAQNFWQQTRGTGIIIQPADSINVICH